MMYLVASVVVSVFHAIDPAIGPAIDRSCTKPVSLSHCDCSVHHFGLVEHCHVGIVRYKF